MFAGDGDAEQDGHGLTEYELERIAHIRRNREIMKRLGLGDHDIVTAARQRCGHDVKGGDGDDRKKTSSSKSKKTKEPRKSKRPRDGDADTDAEGGDGAPPQRMTRRSRRLAAAAASGNNDENDGGNNDGNALDDVEEDWRWRRRDGHSVVCCDGVHEAEAEAYRLRNAGVQERVSVVGTASYQHTLMRVRTMSEDALARRRKAIERAKGKHAVVKMRLFARVLFLEGYSSLADEATESLERLVAELGDPEAEEEEEGEVEGEDGDDATGK